MAHDHPIRFGHNRRNRSAFAHGSIVPPARSQTLASVARLKGRSEIGIR
jgi:hypothetical protein